MGHQVTKPRKQKDPNRRSGRTKGQGVPAGLAAVRAKTQFGSGGLRTCKHCNRVAMRGIVVCWRHGGAMIMANKGEYVRRKHRVSMAQFIAMLGTGEQVAKRLEPLRGEVYFVALANSSHYVRGMVAKIYEERAIDIYLWTRCARYLVKWVADEGDVRVVRKPFDREVLGIGLDDNKAIDNNGLIGVAS